MPNLLIRALSGAVYVALILGSLIFSPREGFVLLMLLFAILGAIEYTRMTGTRGAAVKLLDIVATALPVVWVLFVSALPFGFIFLSKGGIIVLALCFLYPFVRMCVQLFRAESAPLERTATGSLGFYYIGVSLAATAYAACLIPSIVILMFIMLWLNDTGAYLVGCRWGRTKLYERISPKKTREGAAGGALFAMAAGAVAPILYPALPFGSVAGIVLGLIVCITGTLGDLVESMIKREEGVKDSGSIMPGHGGILDRIDSLLMAGPVTLLFILYLLR